MSRVRQALALLTLSVFQGLLLAPGVFWGGVPRVLSAGAAVLGGWNGPDRGAALGLVLGLIQALFFGAPEEIFWLCLTGVLGGLLAGEGRWRRVLAAFGAPAGVALLRCVWVALAGGGWGSFSAGGWELLWTWAGLPPAGLVLALFRGKNPEKRRRRRR